MATVLVILLVVGYAWSVWLLWRQMHFDETPAASTCHAGAVASTTHASRAADNRGHRPAYQTGGTLPRTQIAPAFSVPADGSPAPRREMLDVRKEIEARVLALKSV
jgi:hypothetical protein